MNNYGDRKKRGGKKREGRKEGNVCTKERKEKEKEKERERERERERRKKNVYKKG